MARRKTSLALEGAKKDMTTSPQGVEELHKKLELITLAKRLSSWESRFVDNVMIGYDIITALEKSGCNLEIFGDDAKKIQAFGEKTLKNYDVQRYIISATDLYKFQAPKAISTITKIMNESADEKTRLDAAKFIATEAAKSGADGGSLPTTLVLKFVKQGEEDKVVEGGLVKEAQIIKGEETIPPLIIKQS